MGRWLVWCFLVVGGCKSEDVVECAEASCVCGPTFPCAAGLICDPITMTCVRRVVRDAGVAMDASHD